MHDRHAGLARIMIMERPTNEFRKELGLMDKKAQLVVKPKLIHGSVSVRRYHSP